MTSVSQKWQGLTIEVKGADSISKETVLDECLKEWLSFLNQMDFFCQEPGHLIVQDILPDDISGNLSFWLKRAWRRERAQMATYDEEQDQLMAHNVFWQKEEVTSQNLGEVFKNDLLPLTPAGDQRALLLDRDGIINVDSEYVFKKEDVQFVDGVDELIREANQLGLKVIVLTNQSGVGRGYYKEEDVIALHQWMQEELAQKGAIVDDWFYSPYHPESTEVQYKKSSYTRKPMPGMALMAAKKHHISLEKSLMVGDKISDVLAQVDIKTLLLVGNYPVANYPHLCQSHHDVIKEMKQFFS